MTLTLTLTLTLALTVERRLAASGADVDEAQRSGMEKRVQVRCSGDIGEV